MDKQALIRALCAQLQDEIARATDSATRTREGAVHEEARPENDKDTRALEASYLARGQAQRVVDLQEALKQIRFMDVRCFGPGDPIHVSALVQLRTDDETRWYLLAPAGGGCKLELQAAGAPDEHRTALTVDVLTPRAPLGRALIGRSTGDEVSLGPVGRQRDWLIAQVL